jgi:hypothetical protein
MRIRIIALIAVTGAFISCKSERQNLPGVDALGVSSTPVSIQGVKQVVIYREVGGVRTEWLSKEMPDSGLYMHIQVGLPDNKMRLVLATNRGSVCSTYDQDLFYQHPFSFVPITNAHGRGEYVVMETRDSKLKIQSRIIVVGK